MTPSQARNAIRTALTRIIDPKPKKREIDAMWEHFGSRCAFCGVKLERKRRTGHADHLIPASEGGSNQIFNRVLACATCNGDEKLNQPWESFLKSKSVGSDLKARLQRIQDWRKKHGAECKVDSVNLAPALSAAKKVIQAFDKACEETRAARDKGKPKKS